MVDWTQIDPFSTTMTGIYFIIFLILFPSLLYIKFYGATNFIQLTIDAGYAIYGYIERLLLPIFRFLNPYPFQSMLLQFFFCYLIFFAIFITHPFPILKSYPSATNAVLYSFLGFFLVALFIQFVVPYDNVISAARQRQAPGFQTNRRHLERNMPIYIGLLLGITMIIILAVGVAYLAAHHTKGSWLIMTAAIIILCIAILTVLITFLSEFTAINIPSIADIGKYFASKKMFAYIKTSIENTSPSMYILLAFEISYIIAYFVLPIIGNAIYLKSPGNKDYTWLLKQNLKGFSANILAEKELLKSLKGGIDIDWSKVKGMSDLDLRTALYDVGYTTATAPAAAAFVRQNQSKVAEANEKLQDSEDKLKKHKAEVKINKDYSSKQILRNPIYTDNLKKLGSFEDLSTGDDYNYQYAVSAWVFVHNQPPNYRYSANTFTSLINYGNKPNILYNIKEQTLRFMVETSTENKIIFETKDFPLQRWNNIVINYDHGTLDIFINAKLVATIPSIIPNMKFATVSAGATDGISGGICNVVYYSGNLSKDRIGLYYKVFNTQRFPVFSSPVDDYLKKPLIKIKDLYHEHRTATIILAVIGGVLIPTVIWAGNRSKNRTRGGGN